MICNYIFLSFVIKKKYFTPPPCTYKKHSPFYNIPYHLNQHSITDHIMMPQPLLNNISWDINYFPLIERDNGQIYSISDWITFDICLALLLN